MIARTESRTAATGTFTSRRPGAEVTTDRFLSGVVAAFILASFLIAAIPGLSRIPHALIALMLVTLVVRSIRTPLVLRWEPIAPMAVLFVALAFGSVWWSTNQSAAFVSAIGLTVDLAGALLILAALQNCVKTTVVAYSAGVGAGVQAVVALSQHLASSTTRVDGLTGNANSLAIQLSLTAFLLLLVFPRERWVKLIAFAFLVIATVTTGSRKLVFVWFSYVVLLLREVSPLFQRPTLGAALILLLSPVAVWASITFGPTLLSPFEDVTLVRRLEGTLEGRETQKRSDLMEDALVVWREKPVFGHGIDQYRYSGAFNAYSHNNYTELLANFGVLGFGLYYLIFAVLIVRTLMGIVRGSEAAWVIMAILVSILLMDLARVSYSSRMTWLFVAIMAHYTQSFRSRAMSP